MVEGVCGWGVCLCGRVQVFVKERIVGGSSNVSCFLLSFSQAARAEGKPHGPTRLWRQWFWAIHGPRPLIPADQTHATSTCPSVSASASRQPCWAVRLALSLSAISLLPCSPPLPSPPGACWQWTDLEEGLLWQIWMATSFLLSNFFNSSLATNFL